MSVERYVRASFVRDGIEYCPGIEWRDTDFYCELKTQLKRVCANGIYRVAANFMDRASAVEAAIKQEWPDRAYFLEVGRDDEWVQIFQPWGLPRSSHQ